MSTVTNAPAIAFILARYGAMGEVGRFASEIESLVMGTCVVVETSRGPQIARVIAESQPSGEDETATRPVLRIASETDLREAARLREVCETSFSEWERRIDEWDVDLQLIDIERTLAGEKEILYVLNDRGPETTKLALRAAAAGLGVIEVQPVGMEGVIEIKQSGGCGSCGNKH